MARALQHEDLYQIALPSDPRISPDGARVAYVVTTAVEEEDENRSRIYVAGVSPGGEQLAFTAGPSDSAPRWSPDGRWLSFVAKRAGDDAPQLWLLPTAGGEARALTHQSGGVAAPAWSPDGSRVAFLSAVDLRGEPADDKEKKARAAVPVVATRLDYKADGAGLIGARRQHLFVVDVETADVCQLTSGDFSVRGPAWSPAGDRIAFSSAQHEDRDVNPSSSVYVVGAAGGAEPVQVTPAKGIAAAPEWVDDSTIVYAGRADVSPGHTRLFSVLADGGEPSELAPTFDRNVMIGAPGYPGALPQVLADGSLLFCARDKGCTHVYRYARGAGVPSRSEPEKVLGGDDRVVSSFTGSADGTRLAYLVATPDTPGEVYVGRPDGRDEQAVTALFAGALGEVRLFTPEARTFTAPDRVEVHGWLLRDPDASTPMPLLLDIHGGPHNAWTPAFSPARLYHQTLAAAGWAVLTLNPRGSDGYGEAFYTALTGAWGRADLDDFLAPIDDLVAEGTVDADRLAVCGYSYGGYMTCWLTTQTDRFTAAVTGGCLADLNSFFGTSDVGWSLGSLEIGGTPWEERERFADLSPLTHVERVQTPTLVLHGEADNRCPVEQAEQWFSALRALGCDTEMVRYPGASHLFVIGGRPSHRVDLSQRIEAWVSSRAGMLDGELE
jgi:dipeptidyl aminopeptidase/acylaminoacyl peptidase